jgi:hypothetical protein
MDKVRKPNISVCYTPSSEPYSIYFPRVCLVWKIVYRFPIHSNFSGTSFTYGIYTEPRGLCSLFHPISEPSLDESPFWIPVISYDVSNSRRRSVLRGRLFVSFHKVSVSSVQVHKIFPFFLGIGAHTFGFAD